MLEPTFLFDGDEDIITLDGPRWAWNHIIKRLEHTIKRAEHNGYRKAAQELSEARDALQIVEKKLQPGKWERRR